ncbi:MAG: CPBP family glutamic-type intramembrane protease [Acidimicrobiales bacterium]
MAVAPALLTGVLLVAHNLVVDRLPRWAYVPACLATTATLLVVAGVPDVGPSMEALVVGCAMAVVAVGAVGLAAHLSVTRRLFHDQRLTGSVAYLAFVRIPLGTVVLEEVAFRGVLLAGLGLVPASLLFGLWQVVPTHLALNLNGVAAAPRARVGALAAAVAASALAGAGLCWLRLATGSLLAPAIVHAATTSSATVLAYWVTRPARSRPPG